MNRLWALAVAASSIVGVGNPGAQGAVPPDLLLVPQLVTVVGADTPVGVGTAGTEGAAGVQKPKFSAPPGWECEEYWEPEYGEYDVTCTPPGGNVPCKRLAVKMDAAGQGGYLTGKSHCEWVAVFGDINPTPGTVPPTLASVSAMTPFGCGTRESVNGAARPWKVVCTAWTA